MTIDDTTGSKVVVIAVVWVTPALVHVEYIVDKEERERVGFVSLAVIVGIAVSTTEEFFR